VTQQQGFVSLPFAVKTECKRYEGRVAVIHGGGQGLGRVIGKRMAEEGAKIIIADIQEEKAKQTAADIKRDTGVETSSYAGDMSVAGVADDMAAQVLKDFGRLDVLVNTAAYQMRKPFLSFTEEMMQKAMNWNLWNTLRACKAVIPAMMEQHYGRIVNIGGSAFERGNPYHSFLAGAGKGGIVGLTTTLAGELVTHGITLNCVSPSNMEVRADGTTDSKAGGREAEFNPTDEEKKIYPPMTGGSPMGRPAHPTEVAAAVAFFASPEASYITGQMLSVTGGGYMI